MKPNEKFNNILNDCLERLFKGDTVENCLKSYPEQARELEPLLRTARAARVASTIQPRPEFKARARYEFQAALQDMAEKKKHRRSFLNWNWNFQWRQQSGWAIGAMAAVVVLVSGGGTAVAASGSMPDSALYSVKLATEKVQLAVTSSDVVKVELNAKFANRRADEIHYLASSNDAAKVQSIVAALNTNLSNISEIAGVNEGQTEVAYDSQTMTVQSAPDGNAPVASGFGGGNVGVDDAQPLMSPASVAAPPAPASPPVAPKALSANSPTPASSAVAGNEVAGNANATGAIAPQAPAVNNGPVPAVNNRSAGVNNNTGNNSNQVNLSNKKKMTAAEKAKLRKIIEDNFQKRQASLEAALEKASSEARPAIRLAIAQSMAEYERDIRTLDAIEVVNNSTSNTNGTKPSVNIVVPPNASPDNPPAATPESAN